MAGTEGFASYRFATDTLPARDRVEVWREVFGRSLIRLDMEPMGEGPFRCDALLRNLPGVSFAQVASSPFSGTRSRELLADGRNDIGLLIPLEGGLWVSQYGKEATLAEGDAVVLRTSEFGAARFPTGTRYANICAPETVLAPLLADPGDVAMTVIPAQSEALRLLVGYAGLLHADGGPASSLTAHIIGTHLHDLIANAISATCDAMALIEGRGLRAARLQAIKADIARHAGDATLSLEATARRQKISPSYIRKLFASDGTSFSELVLARRLAAAHRMLCSPLHDHRSISAIAYEAGFGDLSYFNRAFRRRFDATPSDVREEARLQRRGRT